MNNINRKEKEYKYLTAEGPIPQEKICYKHEKRHDKILVEF
jgi:hypothetical protein